MHVVASCHPSGTLTAKSYNILRQLASQNMRDTSNYICLIGLNRFFQAVVIVIIKALELGLQF